MSVDNGYSLPNTFTITSK